MVDLAAFATCAELTPEHADAAKASLAEMKKLLARAAQVARPGEGAPKVLMAVAALTDAPWLEGELRVELSGEGEATVLDVFCDHGFGIRERLLPQTRFRVAFDEFFRAAQLAPGLVAPLRASGSTDRLVLTIDGESPTAPPPAFELDEESLVVDEHEKKTVPPVANVAAPREEPSVHTRPTVRAMHAVSLDALEDPPSGEPRSDER